MRMALQKIGSSDGVLAYRDDLSCGPIIEGTADERARWWSQFDEDRAEVTATVEAFWDQLLGTDETVVLWCGARAAGELAFLHAAVERLGNRPVAVVDVSSAALHGIVSQMNPDRLAPLVSQARTLSDTDRKQVADRWGTLRSENAPFRIVAESGLASAGADHFDPLLLAHLGSEPKSVKLLVMETMTASPFMQTNVAMLRWRVSALARVGRMVFAEGETEESWGRVRLP
jgi:hypothetical protein